MSQALFAGQAVDEAPALLLITIVILVVVKPF